MKASEIAAGAKADAEELKESLQEFGKRYIREKSDLESKFSKIFNRIKIAEDDCATVSAGLGTVGQILVALIEINCM